MRAKKHDTKSRPRRPASAGVFLNENVMVFAYNRRFLWSYCCNLFKPSPAMPDPAANREHEHARRHPDRETGSASV